MAAVSLDEKDHLVVLTKDFRDPLLRLAVDAARELVSALLAGADAVEAYAAASGKLLAASGLVTDVWEAKVGYFQGGVVVQFNRAGTRVPLPPAVARHLADRVQSAINAAETGLVIRRDSGDPSARFGPRPTLR
jgi:predicted deacylase